MVLADVLKAAAEPTRLRLLNLLRQGDICVCDLQQVLDLPQPTVSRHLKELRQAGLVTDRRDGARVVYSLVAGTNPHIRSLYQLLDQCCPLEGQLREDT